MSLKTVLITGASRGIGAACARRFSAAGYAVGINYLHAEAEAQALVRALDSPEHPACALRADVADAAQVQQMVDNMLEKFCQLDNLVCNAGVAQTGLLTDFSTADWRRIFAVNVDGVFHCCRAAIPQFIHQKAGNIITMSSMWGVTGGSCEVPYSAAKAAVIGLTRALAKELGPSGVRVNCVAPGVIDTAMNAALSAADLDALRAETPLGVLGTATDVAESVFFLASDAARFITGQILSPNGGICI